MTQFLKFIVHSTEADNDATLEFPCIVKLDTILGFFPNKANPMWTDLRDSDGYYTATHSIEHIMLAMAKSDMMGPVIDIVQFVADEEAINAVLTPSRNRAIALAKAEELAKNKIN